MIQISLSVEFLLSIYLSIESVDIFIQLTVKNTTVAIVIAHKSCMTINNTSTQINYIKTIHQFD